MIKYVCIRKDTYLSVSKLLYDRYIDTKSELDQGRYKPWESDLSCSCFID